VSQPFDAWSFCRDVLVRGAAIEQDTRATGRGYEQHSFRLDDAARELTKRVEPHLSAVPADDAEPVTADWLLASGFVRRGATQSYGIYGFPPTGEYMLTLKWVTPLMVMAYVFDSMVDETRREWTRGHVRRLCSALGVQLKESA
jgi:hypothetical protein